MESSTSRAQANQTKAAGRTRARAGVERVMMHARNGLQISRRVRVALEYGMAIVTALASSYVILRLGL